MLEKESLFFKYHVLKMRAGDAGKKGSHPMFLKIPCFSKSHVLKKKPLCFLKTLSWAPVSDFVLNVVLKISRFIIIENFCVCKLF